MIINLVINTYTTSNYQVHIQNHNQPIFIQSLLINNNLITTPWHDLSSHTSINNQQQQLHFTPI